MRVGAVDHLFLVGHVRLVTVQVVLVFLDRSLAQVTVELQQHTVDFVAVVHEIFAGQQQRHAHESQPKQVCHVTADAGAVPGQIVAVPSETGGCGKRGAVKHIFFHVLSIKLGILGRGRNENV